MTHVGTKTDALERDNARYRADCELLFKVYGELFPSCAWTDSQTAIDLLRAEVLTVRKKRDWLLKIIDTAYRQTGCDGDLCYYAWHEDAREALADAREESAEITPSPPAEVAGAGQKGSAS